MRHLMKVIKGSLVGLGSILPGISGSMVAAILKIYQDLIDALNQVTQKPIQAIKQIWQYIVGVFLGLIVGFIFIKLFFDISPIPITMLFVGFILGAIPLLVKEVKGEKILWHHLLTFVLAIAVMISLLFVTGTQADPSSWRYYLVVIAIGIIYAIALIIPGLSGSTMLLAFGFFHLLIDIVSNIGTAVITFDGPLFVEQLPILLLLILGTIVGLIGMGKVMHVVIHRFKTHFYIAVLGIVIVSPINILVTLNQDLNTGITNQAWYIYVIASLLFIGGFSFTFWLSTRKQNKEVSV